VAVVVPTVLGMVDAVDGVNPGEGLQDLESTQTKPDEQHPPPRLTGQACKPEKHERVDCSAVSVSVPVPVEDVVEGVVVLNIALVWTAVESDTAIV